MGSGGLKGGGEVFLLFFLTFNICIRQENMYSKNGQYPAMRIKFTLLQCERNNSVNTNLILVNLMQIK